MCDLHHFHLSGWGVHLLVVRCFCTWFRIMADQKDASGLCLLRFQTNQRSNFNRNSQVDLQAQDRAHRIGQKNEVQVFRFGQKKEVQVLRFCTKVLFLLKMHRNGARVDTC